MLKKYIVKVQLIWVTYNLANTIFEMHARKCSIVGRIRHTPEARKVKMECSVP